MKKLLIAVAILLVAVMLFVFANESVSETKIDKTIGDISYKEIRDRELIGYETVYKEEEYVVEICSTDTINDTESLDFGKEQTTCWDEVHSRTVIDKSKQGDPIYSYSDIKALEYNGERIDFDDKGCFICDTINYEEGGSVSGKLLLCLSNIDGYASNGKTCWVESGASYVIKDLVNDKTLESHFDRGVMIK